jgi:uncharacterized protein YdeI (YjbR/CyaY-like superfamily)
VRAKDALSLGGTSTTPTEWDEPEVIAFRDAGEFAAWLDAHVDLQVGVWLKIAKKRSGVRSLTSEEAVDIGLCYGWISGQRKALDEATSCRSTSPAGRAAAGRRSTWPRSRS